MFFYIVVVLFIVFAITWIFFVPFFKQVNLKKSNIGQNSYNIFDTVVIIGGSISGLLAAATLSRHSKKVIIIEQHNITKDLSRSLVPHGDMTHVLLQRGLDIIDKILPGTIKLIKEGGAHCTDLGSKTFWHTFDDPKLNINPNDTGLSIYLMSRHYLEKIIREKLLYHCTNIEIKDECKFSEFLYETKVSGTISINGIKYIYKDHEFNLSSDIVVDCSGMCTSTPHILKRQFGVNVKKDSIKTKITYSSAKFQIPEDDVKHDFVYYMQIPPHINYSSMLYKIEGKNIYHFNQCGLNDRKVATDYPELFEMLQENKHDLILSYLKKGTPISPTKKFSKNGDQYHYFENLTNINGFIAMGDSVCSVNPIFAQGMTLACESCLILDDLIRNNKYNDMTCHIFQKKLSYALTIPWLLATTFDIQFKATTGGSFIIRSLLPIISKIFNFILRNAACDKDFFIDFINFANMTQGFTWRLLIPLRMRKLFNHLIN